MDDTENNIPQNKNANNKVDIPYNFWLGVRDSNPRMPGPKPGALPLGEPPTGSANRVILSQLADIFNFWACRRYGG
jgi:hypothetical protein